MEGVHMPAAAARLGGRMAPIIDEDELERIREGGKNMGRRPWYTEAERLKKVDQAIADFGFKSSNALLDRAVDWYIQSLYEIRETKKKTAKK
jgi:hypothetical protein